MNDVDLIWIPRVNTVEGMTQQDIQKWGWRISENNWVNYPDYQSRIFKNSPEIRWQSKVHERIHGAQTYAHLPPHEELSLYHPKTIDKQEKQNKFLDKKKKSQPSKIKTCGSTFKNPSNKKAWELIKESGCSDLKVGGAKLSNQHCNFFVNEGYASTSSFVNSTHSFCHNALHLDRDESEHIDD